MTALASATPIARRPSPTAAPSGGPLRTFLAQARSELLKVLRAPDFVAPVVLLPIVLYVLFGSPALGQTMSNGVAVGPLVTASFTAYGVLGIAIFVFGEGLATERGQGWLRLVRATPLPGATFLLGKLAAAIALMGLFLVLMIVVSTVIGGGVSPSGWLLLAAATVLGGVALCPLAATLGLLVRPNAGGAVSLLLYLPLSYASGMWMPIETLPELLRTVAPVLPTYHLAELAQAAAMPSLGVEGVAGHVAWLVGTFALGGAFAAAAYRRVAGRQFA